ncbi:hypothetical protein DB347_14580 [Opitutaceae bacterium EW11]|nr:hypothetical protein DB347_14580 [Opitutaceae bacterium EW11]
MIVTAPARFVLPVCLAVFAAFLASEASATNADLASSPSGFLRAHAENAVTWMPWSPAAVERAKKENKPLYLAVGSLTHELSRAMNRQTFSNAQVGALLNENFVCVLIDRDEHPEIAAYCQNFLNHKKQLSGWPVNVWLTPELKPFEGATYLPPSEEWGKEGFMNVAQRAATAWKTDADAQRQKGDDALAEVAAVQNAPLPAEKDAKALKLGLASAAQSWASKLDPVNGGFGDSPRYPEPELLRFLLREPAARNAAVASLRALARNATHDPLDGGFFRSSVDAAGRVPTLVKTSLDQARIALAFLEAATATRDSEFEAAARSALDFAYNQLRAKDGTYIAAIDASADENRSAFGWSYSEIVQALGAKEAKDFCRRHGAAEQGNVRAEDDPSSKLTGKNILQYGTFEKGAAADASACAKLRQLRAKRITLSRDEAVVAGTQGWMLAALATAGRTLKDKTYSARAAELADALRRQLLDESTGALRRLAGSNASASAADYLSVSLGYASLGDLPSRTLADRLQGIAVKDCFDAEHGRFLVARVQAPELPLRPVVPDGTAAEPPRAETVALLGARELAPAPAPLPPFAPLVARTLGALLDDPTVPVRGDALLALSVFSSGSP